ncbi:RNA-binding S1 [Neomoorella thermoacetica]|uniref:RNA binding S1 n=2 Tax=Neomoorella thermoacetica TaxID=1525 RepID=Q2RLK3_MOOTA|nr:RNA-binding S1 [Moorella thermoacetica]AKX95744.1 30S ribosomal protein S1 [Moorella thermoacetica]OIQ11581.1 30S ribosomal protein S1 [Moorella thermoacetica]OIQ53442.1 30S ribosomal protein S1 [Moorella thermoacetica]OIQ54579.1 30S ribosomal protein S1 [Moorella thermoacetica]OIQ59911.1 30S ribosomal protein S1 [Moorella thermoacetica]
MFPEGFKPGLSTLNILYEARNNDWSIEAIVSRVTWPDGQGAVWELIFPDIEEVRGLVPASESGLPKNVPMEALTGQTIRVKVKGIDKENNLAACSRVEVVAEAKERLLKTLVEGEKLDALVRAVLARPSRLVLDIGGGVLVVVPREKAAYNRALPLNAQYNPGSLIKAQVEKIDRQEGIIEVAPINPWEKADFRRGDFISGKVIRVYGKRHVLVEVPPGITGLAPYPLRKTINQGDQVTCKVMAFNKAKKILHLQWGDYRAAGNRKRRQMG